MLLECINTSVWNLFIIPEEDWSQSKSIEEYEVNKLKNEDGYSCFYALVQLPGHSSKTVQLMVPFMCYWFPLCLLNCNTFSDENRTVKSTMNHIK